MQIFAKKTKKFRPHQGFSLIIDIHPPPYMGTWVALSSPTPFLRPGEKLVTPPKTLKN